MPGELWDKLWDRTALAEVVDEVRLVEGDTEWQRGSLNRSKTGADTMSMRGPMVGRVQASFAVVLFELLAAGCFGEGGDHDVWDEPELSSGQLFIVNDRIPVERRTADSGLVLEVSAGWAEALGIANELPFESGSIRVSVTFSTDSTKWCDLGEMAVRDDVTGERHVFLKDGGCIRKGGEVRIDGIFEDEPLAYSG